jgi:hypothetical protein
MMAIRHCVIHRIPQRVIGHQAGPEPELSDVESELGERVALFLAERIANNLADAYVVQFDPTTASPVPALVRDFFGNPSALVAMSRAMATHLHTCQGALRAMSPAGLLLVAEIAIDQRLALAILKVEEEDGVQIATRQELVGQRGFRMVLQEDLFFTQKTRVYKVSKFEIIDQSIEGRVLDSQQGPGTLVAGFFLTNFLGCRFGVRADLSTQQFMNTAEAFFNNRVTDSGTRTRYEIALLAVMHSNDENIRVRQFASTYLNLEHQREFEENMRDAGVPKNVPKDVTLVSHRIENIQWQFASGIFVVAPPDQAGTVNTEMDGERTRLTIEGKLTKTSGRGNR